MAKAHSADLDMFTGEAVKPETRAEKKAKQKEIHLRSADMPGVTMERLWKSRSSIQSKRVHWSQSDSTKHVACGVPTSIGEATILVELVNCEGCQKRAREAWEALVRRGGFHGVEEDEE